MIVHLDSPRFLHRWVREVPAERHAARRAFWPGPITLVMPRAANVHDIVTGGQDTVAIRVPAHPMAQQLLTAFGGGIAAPSANRYGRLRPTRAEHVREEFGDAVRVILDGGECQIGLESTIVAFEGEEVRLLRPGAVTVARSGASSGTAGRRGCRLAAGAREPAHALRAEHADDHRAVGRDRCAGGRRLQRRQRIAVLAQRLPLSSHKYVTWVNAGRRPEKYAHDLYSNLRALDKAGCQQILVQDVPDGERWDAVRDRLLRAATRVAESDDGSGTMAVLP